MKQQQKNTNVQQVERFGLKYYTSALLGKAVVQQGTQNTDYTKKKRYSFSGRKSRAIAWAFLSQRRPGKLYEEKYLAKQLDEEPQEATTDGIALKKICDT